MIRKTIFLTIILILLILSSGCTDSNVDSNKDSNIDSNIDPEHDENINSNIGTNIDSNTDQIPDSNSYSGTYSGPNDVFILIEGDTIKRFQITVSDYSFSQFVDAKGEWKISDEGSFNLEADGVSIEGVIWNDDLRGSWRKNGKKDSWDADRVK